MKRSPLGSREVPLRRSSIARVSKKRQRDNRTYSKLCAEFLAEHAFCRGPYYRMDLLTGCGMEATEVHHKRGRVGTDFLDTTRWAPLCHSCHQWATEHPAQAIACGLSLSRVGVTTEHPVAR